MFLVDTNVISEPLSRQPNAGAVEWIRENAPELFVSAVTVKELRFGVARMPEGRRKRALSDAVGVTLESLGAKVLPFDREAAEICGQLEADSRAAGHNCSVEDLMIAATALSHGLTVATRNAKDFAPLGVAFVNPFAGDDES